MRRGRWSHSSTITSAASAGIRSNFDTCIIQTEEDGQKCAGQLLNAHVKVADQGLAIVGNASYYNTVNGKFPIIISGEGSLLDSTTKHVYLTNGSGAVYVAHMADIAKSLGAKSVAVVSSSNPAGKYGASLMIGEMKKLGLSYKVVYEADTGTTPDYASALQAAGASSADMVALIPASVNGCISTFDAMKQLAINKKVVTTYTCYGSPFPQQAGSGLSNWYFSGYTTNPHIVSDPDVQAWSNVMTAYGQAKWQYTGNAPQELQDLLLITRFANQIGYAKVTPAALEAKLLAYDGPGFMIPGTIHCGAHPAPQIGVCGNESAASSFKNGQFRSLHRLTSSGKGGDCRSDLRSAVPTLARVRNKHSYVTVHDLHGDSWAASSRVSSSPCRYPEREVSMTPSRSPYRDPWWDRVLDDGLPPGPRHQNPQGRTPSTSSSSAPAWPDTSRPSSPTSWAAR